MQSVINILEGEGNVVQTALFGEQAMGGQADGKTNQGISSQTGARFKAAKREIVPPFFSQLQRVIEAKMPNKAVPVQVLAIIKGGQVKAEEIKWSGIEDWLKGQAGRVTKDDVINYLRANDVQIEEVTYGGDPYSLEEINNSSRFRIDDDIDTWSAREVIDFANERRDSENEITDISEAVASMKKSGFDVKVARQINTKYERYNLPGGDNYRELLFTMPIGQPKDYIIQEVTTYSGKKLC